MAGQTAQFQIQGMTCASCVLRVEKTLAALQGVETARVNLASETAAVSFDDAVPVQVLADALDKAGYPMVTGEATLDIESMTCASCVARVERVLDAVPGVLSASVNLATETAEVRFAAGSVAPADLVAAVSKAGYPARLKAGEDPDRAARKATEFADLARRTLIAAILTLPVFVIEMGGHLWPPLHHWVAANIGAANSHYLQFALTTLVIFGPGRQFYLKGFPALLKAAPDMNSLVAVGTSAAYLFSVTTTFIPSVLPEGTAQVYYEAAAVIVVLILLGRLLEARAKGRTGAAIRRLMGLAPRSAYIERGGKTVEVPIGEIVVGDIVHLRPGERVAVDGEVLTGRSFLDESMLTGEPVPVEKSLGQQVTAGTLNGNGALTFAAVRVGADTVLAQVIRMVEQAQGAKLPVQGLVDRITAWFVPAVMAVAALSVLVWLIFGPDPALGHALVAGVAVLIIACPCAMGLATPTSIMVGTGRAAELGVLFRKGAALQSLHEARTVAFDKTGTLTRGRPELTDLVAADNADGGLALALAAALEAHSEHPIARAVLREAERRGLDLPAVDAFEALTGFGLEGQVGGHKVFVGAERLLDREGIDPGTLTAKAEALARQGRTPLFVAIDGKVAALIGVADPVKPGAREMVAALHQAGLRVAMITGDAKATAEAIAGELGIDDVDAEVLPGGKVAAIERLRQTAGPVAFVGDGINDAPALAAADTGIAVGSGTDVAIEAADVVLMSGDPRGVVNALDLSRRTMRNIRQNLFWAFGYNILLIPVAAGALYPFGGPMLSPALGAGAMALSSVFVLTNALRLRRVRPALTTTGGAPPTSGARVAPGDQRQAA